ncbi:hypothetical protein GGX14DRAFT_656872 [Mycena pura]|uniref:Uncharacterized protein n=1 Tax=Mycena pura TaxID=153505 RepID=A0AAD7E0K8_9AGAR|nr:hypothetical protein GGX14DRAFT_656872 [Mycena pura]
MSAPKLEVPYEQIDMEALKPALVAMVQRQVEKWPGKFKSGATTAVQIRKVLMDPQHGFTKPSSSVETRNSSPLMDILTPSDQNPTNFNDSKDPIVKHVKLLIEDTRAYQKPIKISQDIFLTVFDQELCNPGEWRANLHELLEKLQSTNAALTGSVKLAIRDHEYPDHHIYFVKVQDDTPLEEAQTSPEFATIPATNCVEVFAEDPKFHLSGSQRNADAFDVTDPSAKPLEHARQRAALKNNTNPDVAWLMAEIKTLPGHPQFVEHCRKVQQNAGIVASWNFVSPVSSTYFKQLSHIAGRENKKIKKKTIQQALDVGSTTLAEAENATRILKRYGENGTEPAQAVIDRVHLTEDKPQGARVLYPFLVKWEKDHRN